MYDEFGNYIPDEMDMAAEMIANQQDMMEQQQAQFMQQQMMAAQQQQMQMMAAQQQVNMQQQMVGMMQQQNAEQINPFISDIISYDRMLELGFEPVVLQTRDNILNTYGKLTAKGFEMCGVYNAKLKQDVLYADKIIRGLIPVDNKVDLKKHLQKMGFDRKISVADLATSITPKNELLAIVRGLPAKSIFGIYNTEEGATQKVDTITSKYVTILSDKYYKINARQSKKLFRVKDLINNRIKYYDAYEDIERYILDNPQNYAITRVAELQHVQTVGSEKMVSVILHRDYCRLLGRFMIVASLKAPDLHLGAYELLTLGGTTVYVFAKQVKFNQRADIKYSTGSERVYYIGTDESEIEEKLIAITNQVKQKVKGVYAEEHPATAQFVAIEPWQIDKDTAGEGEGNTEGNEVTSQTDNTDF